MYILIILYCTMLIIRMRNRCFRYVGLNNKIIDIIKLIIIIKMNQNYTVYEFFIQNIFVNINRQNKQTNKALYSNNIPNEDAYSEGIMYIISFIIKK